MTRAIPRLAAVTSYEPHPITRSVSLNLLPGVRPFEIVASPGALRPVPVLTSSRDSYTRPVEPVGSGMTSLVSAKRPDALPLAGARALGATT